MRVSLAHCSNSSCVLTRIIETMQTTFLSVLTHPHIIKMRAFGSGGMFMPKGYFIVLDRLYDTLEARIKTWNRNAKKARSFTNKIIKKKTTMLEEELIAVKLSYAYDLMGAIEYLHKNKLVYRDLKPESESLLKSDSFMASSSNLVSFQRRRLQCPRRHRPVRLRFGSRSNQQG